MRRSADFLRNRRGIAAIEFAMFAPFLAVMIYGLLELTLRFRAADEFQRYVQQAGDYLSREDQLVTADIDAIFNAADDMIRSAPLSGNLHMDVASIGFISDGSPELLWRRHRGDTPPSLDVAEAIGLGEPGESVLRVSVRFTYETPISQLIGAGRMTLEEEVFYRPRVTRVIAINGKIFDSGANWTNDGDSTAPAPSGDPDVEP